MTHEQYSAKFIAAGLEKSKSHTHENGKRFWRACCPAHKDKDPSLDIEDGDKGPIFVCRAGCSQAAIIAALRAKGLWLDPPPSPARGAKSKPQGNKERPARRLVATYDYRDAAGQLRYQKLRYDPKNFPQRRPDGRGGWIDNLDGVERLPYRLPELLAAITANQPVYIVEGEKDADALARIGLPATTNSDGAGDWPPKPGQLKWPPELNPHFKGARVLIIPDNDKKGRDHCKLVGSALQGIAAFIDVLELPGLAEKGDASDWLAAGGTADQLQALPTRPFAEWFAAQPVHVETDDERLARLAALKPLDYDRCRKAEAEAAGVQPRALDAAVKQYRGKQADDDDADETPDFLTDPEPWPDPVDGADLLNRIVEAFSLHIVLPPGGAATAALWALHAHAHDCSMISPILAITSPTAECGKTSLLTITAALVPRALPAANITTAALFRAVEKWAPTLLIDEADSFLADNNEMRGVLNSGHQRANAYVIRTVDTGGDLEPRRFRTWSPKAIAMIGKLPATLTSRAIPIDLRRKGRGEKVQRLRIDKADNLVMLCRQAARWVADNALRLQAIDPDIPEELGNRTADNWRPLIAIADAAGGDWPERVRSIALKHQPSEQTAGIMLLEDIRRAFFHAQADQLSSADLAAKLATYEERPWVEWRHDKPITPRQLARLLEPFKIAPALIRIGTVVFRGYKLESFADAFTRYIPSVDLLQRYTPRETADFEQNRSVTEPPDATDRNCEKPSNSADCNVVTDRPPWRA